MESHLPVLAVVVPLLTALLIPLVSFARRGAGWFMALGALSFSAYACVRLLVDTWDGDVVRYSMGNWPVPACLLYTSPSPRDLSTSRMPSSA